jgi:hypothetical protein
MLSRVTLAGGSPSEIAVGMSSTHSPMSMYASSGSATVMRGLHSGNPGDATRAVDVGHWLMNVPLLFSGWCPLIVGAL